MDHVKELKWHISPPKWRKLWVKLINREDLTKITDNTKVCSNHFVLGRPYGQHPHPCLYMRGYNGKESHKDNLEIQQIISSCCFSTDKENSDEYMKTRHGSIKRKLPLKDTTNKRANLPSGENISTTNNEVSFEKYDQGCLAENADPNSVFLSQCINIQKEHQYAKSAESRESVSDDCTCRKLCENRKHRLRKLQDENQELQSKVRELEKALEESHQSSTRKSSYSIENISHSDDLVLLHTGLKSYPLFCWIFNLVKPKLPYIQYYRGRKSKTVKSYQAKKKPEAWTQSSSLS